MPRRKESQIEVSMHGRSFVLVGIAAAIFAAGAIAAPGGDSLAAFDAAARRIMALALRTQGAYGMLDTLTRKAGKRLSGSPGAAAAVEETRRMMEARGFANVHREEVMVPRWERGPVERGTLLRGDRKIPLAVCALGGSVATPAGGVTAEVLEVRSFEELRSLGAAARGKIVFFNRAMDPATFDTFEAYGGAVNQRGAGAVEAGKAGGLAALVRSVTLSHDNVPHTGVMHYADGVVRVPAAAIGVQDAERLSALLKSGERVRVRLELSCRTYPDVPSANVVGEIRGSELPDEVVVVGGHLDSWDKGTGAHDDGAGCVQAIEALSLLNQLGLRPRRTVRAVMFMNEENGLRGGLAYAASTQRANERHVAAIESDRGGFAPSGFTVQADSAVLRRVQRWAPVFAPYRADRITSGGSGADISPLVKNGTPGFGLMVADHRYFDYHHSGNDTIDKVHPRELEMGAGLLGILCYLIAQEGL
jgi:hypothetical protein